MNYVSIFKTFEFLSLDTFILKTIDKSIDVRASIHKKIFFLFIILFSEAGLISYQIHGFQKILS